MEKQFNIYDLKLFLKSFKYCYFLEGDNRTHKRLDKSLELLEKVEKLIQAMKNNTATKWDFGLQYTFDCIVTEDGVNHHEQPELSEIYTGQKIWDLIKDIQND